MLHDFELQLPHGAEQHRAAHLGTEHLDRAFLAKLGQALLQLLLSAAGMARLDCAPQLLIVITARFSRVMWGYRSMAYALTLKHVGVLYQSMYLVATAMDLAPCGLGTGDSDLFAEAAGLDPYVEASVGEFLLGSRPRSMGREEEAR